MCQTRRLDANEKNTQKYLRQIRISFPVFRRNEKRFFNEFRASVEEYEGSHVDCSIDSLNDYFGKPKDVVVEYFNSMEASVYFKIMRKSFYLRLVASATVFLMICFFILQCCMFYKTQQKIRDSIIVKESTTIVYEAD